MRVLLGPGLDSDGDTSALAVARSLAGADGQVVALRDRGVGSLSRALSAAEVSLIREALLGAEPSESSVAEKRPETVVGYVCRGRGAPNSGAGAVIAVTDHADLTWRSPLAGPNDDRLGPRFPRIDGVYAREAVMQRVVAGPGVTITQAVVAGVRKEADPTKWEWEMVNALGFGAVSSELVAVAVIAAHLGVRLAAAVVL